MPKITITEKDYTTPGIGNYANFTVLVAGKAAKTINPEDYKKDPRVISDKIFELSTLADFNELIGAKDADPVTLNPIFASPLYREVSGQAEKVWNDKLTINEYYGAYADQVYTAGEGSATAPTGGKGENYVKIADEVEEGAPQTYKYYQLTKEAAGATYASNKDYVVVLKGNECQDVTTTTQMGNQIAYELLDLGYPVLYRVLGNGDDLSSYENIWADFEDKANFDFRCIINGLYAENSAPNAAIIKLAATRGDCVALCDIDASKYMASTVTTTQGLINAVKDEANAYSLGEEDGKYAAFFAPTVCYNLSTRPSDYREIYKNERFPGGFHYLACFANSLASGNPEWFAAAGLTRGVSRYSLVGADAIFGDAADKALEPRTNESGLKFAVNLVEKVRTNYYLWGNRTAHTLGEELVASDFLNIRQLCSTLKKQIYVACRRYTFDPNSDTLWVNFCNAIIPTLEAMKSNQGIGAYEIIRVATNKKATLKARVRITPVEAVEDFDIEISLEDTLGEASVTITE